MTLWYLIFKHTLIFGIYSSDFASSCSRDEKLLFGRRLYLLIWINHWKNFLILLTKDYVICRNDVEPFEISFHGCKKRVQATCSQLLIGLDLNHFYEQDWEETIMYICKFSDNLNDVFVVLCHVREHLNSVDWRLIYFLYISHRKNIKSKKS